MILMERYHSCMTQADMPSLPPRPGNKHPDHWWAQFLDGQVWVFTQGEDFIEPELFRANLHNYVRRQNMQTHPRSPLIMKVATRKLLRQEDMKWQMYIQASWPYQKSQNGS